MLLMSLSRGAWFVAKVVGGIDVVVEFVADVVGGIDVDDEFVAEVVGGIDVVVEFVAEKMLLLSLLLTS